MKAELVIPKELIKEIASGVAELLKPILNSNGEHKSKEDTIFNIESLSEYLKVTKKWIYDRTHLKEIPHYKIDGTLRFRKKEIDRWLNSYKIPDVDPQSRIFKTVK